MVLIFPTTHLTLLAEKSLERAGIKYRTVMKPRKISSDCGLAIRVDPASLQRCREAVLADGVVPVRFFTERDGKWECVDETGESDG